MNQFPRLFLPVALLVILVTAACGAEGGATPTTVIGTIVPTNSDLTSTPFTDQTTSTAEFATAIGTATGLTGPETSAPGAAVGTAAQGVGTLVPEGATQTVNTVAPRGGTTTPLVPVTGEDIMLVECQFCVDTRAHALLVLPDTATFNIVSPAPTTTNSTTTTTTDSEPRCTTVEVNNGRQVVLCSGPEMTPLVVNICTDANTCTDFPVDLLACPLTQGGQVNPAQTPAQKPPAPGAVASTPTATPLTITSTPNITISTPTP